MFSSFLPVFLPHMTVGTWFCSLATFCHSIKARVLHVHVHSFEVTIEIGAAGSNRGVFSRI